MQSCYFIHITLGKNHFDNVLIQPSFERICRNSIFGPWYFPRKMILFNFCVNFYGFCIFFGHLNLVIFDKVAFLVIFKSFFGFFDEMVSVLMFYLRIHFIMSPCIETMFKISIVMFSLSRYASLILALGNRYTKNTHHDKLETSFMYILVWIFS